MRGTIRDAQSGREIPGVLITLLRADSTELRNALTDAGGKYSIRTPGPDTYRIAAKRIGSRRFMSAPILVRDGETKVEDIELAAIEAILPEVAISARMLCASSREQFSRVASLWEEVHTALSATAISERDTLYAIELERYIRQLDPRTLRVLSEQRERHRGLVTLPFSATSPDSLSAGGYWKEDGDTTTFYGLDVNVLLSESFRRDHCFGLARSSRDKPGQIGLTFEPARDRQLPDIRGTMWLDSATYHLSSLEYSYTRLPRLANIERVGGQFRFVQLPGGAWIVRQWQIRMPHVVRYSDRPSHRRIPTSRVISPPVVHRIVETGGEAYLPAVGTTTTSAALEGVVLDSLGAPMPFSLVTVSGTSLSTTSGSSGTFRMSGVPEGDYEVHASDSASRSFGVSAAIASVQVLRDSVTKVELRAGRAVELMTRLCGGRPVDSRTSVLRIVLTTAAQPASVLRMTWTEYESVNGLPRVVMQRLESAVDRAGLATFCGLPLHIPIDVELATDELSGKHLATIRNATAGPVTYRVGFER